VEVGSIPERPLVAAGSTALEGYAPAGVAASMEVVASAAVVERTSVGAAKSPERHGKPRAMRPARPWRLADP